MSSIIEVSHVSSFSILGLLHFSQLSATTSTVSSGSFIGLVAPLCPIGAPRFFGGGIFSV
jgi:hypothetical protein